MYSDELLQSAKKLRFPPPIEAEFIVQCNKTTRVSILRYGWAIIAFCFLSIIFDVTLFQEYRWEFFAIRMGMAMLVVIPMIRLRNLSTVSSKRLHILWYLVSAAALFNCFQFFVTSQDGAYASHGLTNIVFFGLIFMLSRASFFMACFGAALVIVIFNMIVIPIHLIPHPEEYRLIYGGTNLRLLIMYGVLAVFGFILERGRRQDFIKTVLLEHERNRVTEQNSEILRQQEILESNARDVELANTSLVNLNNELSRLNNELREANTFKTQMLSMASHDLKNPLMGIFGLTEALLDAEDMTREQQQLFLKRIQNSSEQMIRLIQGFLDSSAIELGAMSLTKMVVHVQDLWENVLLNIQEQARKKHQSILPQIENGCTVVADYDRLYQVFENLLSNAIKYSPEGSQILVSLMKKGSLFCFIVEDQGPGILEQDKAKLFGMFQRLSASPTAGETSHGVGLAIVKHIVDAHGGTIRVEPASNGYSARFIVEIPLSVQEVLSTPTISVEEV